MEFESSKGKIVIEKASVDDLKELVVIFKDVFKIHDIFTKPDSEVLSYLESKVDGFLVAKMGEKTVGGVLVRQVSGGWRLNHLAIASDYRDLDIGSHLIKAAELQIGSGRVTIHLSENEEVALPFYKKMGFVVEKEVDDYYRPGEKVYFLVKEI